MNERSMKKFERLRKDFLDLQEITEALNDEKRDLFKQKDKLYDYHFNGNDSSKQIKIIQDRINEIHYLLKLYWKKQDKVIKKLTKFFFRNLDYRTNDLDYEDETILEMFEFYLEYSIVQQGDCSSYCNLLLKERKKQEKD
ncbi:MAG: hypothetical protein Q4G05_01160 [Clostridia bacterium]|nr:hypothetical protein [Clostridia bacterium]